MDSIWYFKNKIPYEDGKDGIDKLREEYYEFVDAIEHYDGGRNRLSLITEGLDLIHVVENILKHYGVDYNELNLGVQFVQTKNALRGYYEEDTRTNNEKNAVQSSFHGHI